MKNGYTFPDLLSGAFDAVKGLQIIIKRKVSENLVKFRDLFVKFGLCLENVLTLFRQIDFLPNNGFANLMNFNRLDILQTL